MTFEQLGKKRVMMLFPHMVVPGGALNYTLKLSELLSRGGAQVSVLTLCHDVESIDTPDGVEIIAHPRGPVTSSMSFWLLYPMWQKWLNGEIIRWRPDILVSYVFPSNWWGWFAKRAMPEIPMLWICHEPSAFIHSQRWIHALKPVWKSWIARILRPFFAHVDKRLADYGDGVVASSRFTAEQIWTVYGEEVVGIAYPGVDVEEFSRCNEPKQRLLLTVSHLSGFKRIDFLLEVFARVIQRNPDLRFAIVGDGEKMDDLKRLVRKLGITEHVDFCGRLSREELVRMYSRACLYLHGSIREPFGMAPLEALAGGCPVVAHASGGPKEIVTQGTGRLLDTLRHEAWVEAINDLLSEADSQTPEMCRRRAAAFSWEATAGCVASVIGRILVESTSSCSRNGEKLGCRFF